MNTLDDGTKQKIIQLKKKTAPSRKLLNYNFKQNIIYIAVLL